MTIRRTNGHFSGRHSEDGGDPEEISAPVEIESDPVAGVVRMKIRGTAEELRGKRVAMSMAYFQERLRSERARAEYETRRVKSIPKPASKSAKQPTIPTGYALCPACSSGEKDVWDCGECDGTGLISEARAHQTPDSF